MADLLRVSLVGTLPSGEEWSVNPVYSIGGDFGTPVTPAQAQTIATGIAATSPAAAMLNAWSISTNFTGCRVEARSAAGVLETQAEGIRATPLVGTGSAPHSFQTCVVSSLRTAVPGASGRGRLYWPATGITLTAATLRLQSATATALLAAVKTHLSSIQAVIDVTLDGVALGVWSRKLSDVGIVNQIQLGDVLDVQRRRRDTLVETISSISYP
jgi:hypothetical protein